MIDQIKINTLFQIVNSMEDAIVQLEKSYEKKDAGNFEHAKKIILEFQNKLAEELGGR